MLIIAHIGHCRDRATRRDNKFEKTFVEIPKIYVMWYYSVKILINSIYTSQHNMIISVSVLLTVSDHSSYY